MHLQSSSHLNDCSIFIEQDDTVVHGDQTSLQPHNNEPAVNIQETLTVQQTESQPSTDDIPHSNDKNDNHVNSILAGSNLDLLMFDLDNDSYSEFIL